MDSARILDLEGGALVTENNSIAFVCGSKPSDGIFKGGIAMFNSLKELGFKVNWYQCVDKVGSKGYPEDARFISGIQFPSPMISMGLNRMYYFPRNSKKLSEKTFFLLDPSLIRVGMNRANVIVKIYDIRPLTKYADKLFTKFMYLYSIPRLRNVNQIIVATNYMKHELIKLNFNKDKITVIPDISQLSLNSKHVYTSLDRIKGGDVNLLYIATDRPYKNISFLIQLAKAFSKDARLKKFKFHLVSKLKKTTMSEIVNCELQNLFVYSDVGDINNVYQMADILLFPSLYEGFGLPLVEAMSIGMPIICNRLEPMCEILDFAGYFVSPNDLIEWKNAILALSEAQEYKRMSDLCLKRYEHYSPQSYKQKICSVFHRIQAY